MWKNFTLQKFFKYIFYVYIINTDHDRMASTLRFKIVVPVPAIITAFATAGIQRSIKLILFNSSVWKLKKKIQRSVKLILFNSIVWKLKKIFFQRSVKLILFNSIV